MSKRRLFILLCGFCLCILLFSIRLLWVQMVSVNSLSGKRLTVQSVLQRQQRVILDNSRGQFYDRSGEPLTGKHIHALCVFPAALPLQFSQAERIADILNVKVEEWNRFVAGLKVPSIWKDRNGQEMDLTVQQIERIRTLGIAGIMVVPYTVRYSEPFQASHLIGFLSENPQRIQQQYRAELERGILDPTSRIGAAGLELKLDRLLLGQEPTVLSLHTDANQHVLAGLGTGLTSSHNIHYPLKVMLTIDRTIQQRLEQEVDQYMQSRGLREAAVVLMDADQREVVAMISRPAFNPNAPNMRSGNWANHSIEAAVPGSIYKIVIAAAALEKKVVRPNEVFNCQGTLGRYGFQCWKERGHGPLTFSEAFAQSCNITFAQVAVRLAPNDIIETARKLGVLEGYDVLPEEQSGRVFGSMEDAADPGILVQTAIGQRDVRITPLQAANMVVSLLHRGEVVRPKLVKEIRFHNGSLLKKEPTERLVKEREGISSYTANTILGMMEQVVQHGTGITLKQHPWKLAGKSGTAQLGEHGENGDNEWFIGYGPVPSPRYAMAVMVKDDRGAQGHQGTELFGRIMRVLAEGPF
ncbi:peptidoglycan D,D-transpeptidase FtsI family protein [Marinicrinis lubricantis]|uniref:Peptidoglycan D,D-transpeptidase FtsI family protein n=1 Tax=Marinicrinis lubricantis TaxID=2086470 RepID=A0ABW1IVM7_9BACL